jgi:hypothetical protein
MCWGVYRIIISLVQLSTESLIGAGGVRDGGVQRSHSIRSKPSIKEKDRIRSIP